MHRLLYNWRNIVLVSLLPNVAVRYSLARTQRARTTTLFRKIQKTKRGKRRHRRFTRWRTWNNNLVGYEFVFMMIINCLKMVQIMLIHNAQTVVNLRSMEFATSAELAEQIIAKRVKNLNLMTRLTYLSDCTNRFLQQWKRNLNTQADNKLCGDTNLAFNQSLTQKPSK